MHMVEEFPELIMLTKNSKQFQLHDYRFDTYLKYVSLPVNRSIKIRRILNIANSTIVLLSSSSL